LEPKEQLYWRINHPLCVILWKFVVWSFIFKNGQCWL
jgi:hypothetical protein